MNNNKNNIHKHNKRNKNNKNKRMNKEEIKHGFDAVKNSKTITQGISFIKDTALGIGSLVCTAVKEAAEAISTITSKKKN